MLGTVMLSAGPASALPNDATAPAGAVVVETREPQSAWSGLLSGFPEEVDMILVGIALIGLASAVRRVR